MSCTSSCFEKKTAWYSVNIIAFISIWCWAEITICKEITGDIENEITFVFMPRVWDKIHGVYDSEIM